MAFARTALATFDAGPSSARGVDKLDEFGIDTARSKGSAAVANISPRAQRVATVAAGDAICALSVTFAVQTITAGVNRGIRRGISPHGREPSVPSVSGRWYMTTDRIPTLKHGELLDLIWTVV